ncbi:hypothetical protein [Halobacteriovorax sp. HLS]|uniref:hypothetical protein n=1 Tax=Halobacteriovorax sp. HLS TaxID=2234000 RepID=UPI000FDB3979|nr:hypothetical protein [Halobacteriovorax sp. HLS]
MRLLIILMSFILSIHAYSKNTLSVNLGKKKKTEDVKEIVINEEGILITGTKELKCFLPFEKITKGVPVSSHCASCKEEYTEKDRFTDMFKNAKDAQISCEIKDDVAVGFNFMGQTSYRGEGAFVNYGRILDMEVYRTDFHVEEKPGALDNTIRKVEKVLLKLFF